MIAITVIPVAGVADQALATVLSVAFGGGARHRRSGQWHLTRFLSGCSRRQPTVAAAPASVSPETASWTALQATLVVMPVFVLALTNPAFYLAGHHQDGDAGPAGRFHQRPFGRT